MIDDLQKIVTETEAKMTQALKTFETDMRLVRTGRVTPDMLDGIMVDYYGTKTPVSHMATVTVSR